MDDPEIGPDFVYSLNLWQTITSQAFNKVRLDNQQAYNTTFIILHSGVLSRSETGSQIKAILATLLIAFNRDSEDSSLLFRKRKFSKQGKEIRHVPKNMPEEQLQEQIDSNILWAFQQFSTESEEKHGLFMAALAGRMT